MNRLSFLWKVFMGAILCACPFALLGQDSAPGTEKSAYQNSLHYTSRGLEFWYSKEHGGLERITGIPFTQLSCNNCHVRSCDSCHVQQVNGKTSYTTAAAKSEAACEHCHDDDNQKAARLNPESPDVDVHFARGMKCMDCHSTREIHGDGVLYDSLQSPGAMDARCENCHQDLSRCPSSKVHHGKLDCGACHIRERPSCINCHFDTKVAESKSVSLPLQNTLFLVNRNGVVTTAALHTFIYQNKTMIVFAPAFAHLITKQGRKCGDCHGTEAIQDLLKGSFRLAIWDKTQLKNRGGVVPIVEGYNWDLPFLNYVQGQWISAEKPAPPVINYSGYAKPITREQLEKLAQPHQYQTSSPNYGLRPAK
jgi:hypothetical protein